MKQDKRDLSNHPWGFKRRYRSYAKKEEPLGSHPLFADPIDQSVTYPYEIPIGDNIFDN